MVLRENRDKLAVLLRHLAAGVITNDEFDLDAVVLFDDRDPAIEEIYWEAWRCYSDLHRHRLRGRRALGRDQRRAFARAIVFLHSDLEYAWPRPKVSRSLALPFIALAGVPLGLVPGILAGSYFGAFCGACVGPVLLLYAIGIAGWIGRALTARARGRAAPEHAPPSGEPHGVAPPPECWPFASAADLKRSVSKPRLLAVSNRE